MITSIDHIAIAVTDLDEAVRTFSSVLGCAPETVRIETVPDEGVRVAFLPVGGTKIELLEPIHETSPITRFLEKNGDGMHHIAFATDNINSEQERLTESGMRTLGSVRQGAGGKEILFLHPKDTNRVLLELTGKKPQEA
ncbi:MAG: methylmalonyl-CoA epimerase [Chlorobium sp.]|nr:methylmalonyl-CoA epimerase [Chlorobium phaeovibrioides]NQU46275.1 methylmalonyl-CoA epimerase [Chlorobium sp.]